MGGANGQLPGQTNSLAQSDDVVTYRYEYYAYVGPYADWDTHEALAQTVAADGIHGVGTYVDQNGNTNDLSTAAGCRQISRRANVGHGRDPADWTD